MNKKIWDLYAPIYEKAMRMDQKYYAYMYKRISRRVVDKEVLEIATGPGLLAKHVAQVSKRMIATDYSEGMICEALKGNYPKQLKFEVADATCLPYENNSFDVVIIANALHVMPEPQKALKEIDRVLKDGGLLIAPNFVGHKKGVISRIWSGILKIAGFALNINGHQRNIFDGWNFMVGVCGFQKSWERAFRLCIQNVYGSNM